MYQLSIDSSQLQGLTQDVIDRVTPNISYAVAAVAGETAKRWQNNVQQARLWQGEKQPYFESIQWEQEGPFQARIWSDYKLAREIETGRPRKDLKAVLPTAKRARSVRSGKHAGQKYLIIPFRHNIPSPSGKGAHAPQMPPHVYAQAKRLKASRVTGTGQRRSATGYLVPQHSYQWGGRLPAGLTPKAKPNHKTDLHAGMVRFDTSTNKAKSSAYLTFRTMGEWSDGWIVDPRPGQYLAKHAAEGMQAVFADIIRQAIAQG